MRLKRFLKVILLLCVASLCLPWFTYNAKVMGYRWGLMFAKWYVLPLALVGIHLFGKKKGELTAVLAEIAVTANLAITAMVFGRWQELCNIAAGFRWLDGFRTAQPGFWIAAVLMVILFAAFQVEFCWRSEEDRPADEKKPAESQKY